MVFPKDSDFKGESVNFLVSIAMNLRYKMNYIQSSVYCSWEHLP